MEESYYLQAVGLQPLQHMLFGIPSVRLWDVLETYILAFKICRVPQDIAILSGMHLGICL